MIDSPRVFRAWSPFAAVLLLVLVDLVHELLELQVLGHQLPPLLLAQLVLFDYTSYYLALGPGTTKVTKVGPSSQKNSRQNLHP